MSTDADVELYENIFIWKISNFSLFPLDIDTSVYSPLFRTENLFGSTWFMEIYPRGSSRSDFRFASVFLSIKRNDSKIVTCRYKIEIMRVDGLVLDSKSNYGEFYRDSREGWDNYIEIDKLQNKAIYFPNDTLVIRCLLHDCSLYMSMFVRTVPCKLLHGEPSCMPKLTKTVAETNIGFDRIYFNWLIESLTGCSSKSKIIECPATSKYSMKLRTRSREIFLSIKKLYEHSLNKLAVLKISFLGLDGLTRCSITYRFTLKYNCNFYEFPSVLPCEILSRRDMNCMEKCGFSLLCEFSVTNEIDAVGTENFFSHPLISLYPSLDETALNDLQKALLLLYVYKNQCDTILDVDGMKFPVHKFILTARSLFFFETFEKSASNYVEIITNVNIQTWVTFLKFLYIGIIDKLDYATAVELLKLADRYKVISLKYKCCSFIRQIISERRSFNNFGS